MSEVGMASAGRDHQGVVSKGCTSLENNAPRKFVDTGDRGRQGCDLRSPAEQMPYWPGYLRGREGRSRNLIQQGLEEMMVAPVNHCNEHRRTSQVMDRLQATEACAHHRHNM